MKLKDKKKYWDRNIVTGKIKKVLTWECYGDFWDVRSGFGGYHESFNGVRVTVRGICDRYFERCFVLVHTEGKILDGLNRAAMLVMMFWSFEHR